jgi:hypothetical protein
MASTRKQKKGVRVYTWTDEEGTRCSLIENPDKSYTLLDAEEPRRLGKAIGREYLISLTNLHCVYLEGKQVRVAVETLEDVVKNRAAAGRARFEKLSEERRVTETGGGETTEQGGGGGETAGEGGGEGGGETEGGNPGSERDSGRTTTASTTTTDGGEGKETGSTIGESGGNEALPDNIAESKPTEPNQNNSEGSSNESRKEGAKESSLDEP